MDYSSAVLNVWSRPVDAQRIAAHRTEMEPDTSIISFVAVDRTGAIVGFVALVPPDTLGAVYIAAAAGRRGVASALRMDSSLTAAPFYMKHGLVTEPIAMAGIGQRWLKSGSGNGNRKHRRSYRSLLQSCRYTLL